MFEKTIEFLKANGWDVKEIEGAPGRIVRCSVSEFSFNLAYRPHVPNPSGPNLAEAEIVVLLPRGEDEIWSLLQIVQDDEIEVMRCREPINPELLER